MAAAVAFDSIQKSFGAVQASRNVSFEITAGSIHGIIGENGAGKSTLMNILYGFYQADSGQILINGKPARIKTSMDAIQLGIGMIHQHFMLVDSFTVLENIILGLEAGWSLQSSRRAAVERLKHLNDVYGLSLPLEAITGDLPVGVQQRVEIMKALYRGAEILILDEPTAVLTPKEADQLFAILADLRKEGKTIILITHKLREVMAITDRVTVMRGGSVVTTVETADTHASELAQAMVGRSVVAVSAGAAAAPSPGALALEVHCLHLTDQRGVRLLSDITLDLRAGEILGLAGVSGSGQSELLEILSGMRAPSQGEVTAKGRNITAQLGQERAPQVLRQLGISHIPEDRLREGMVKSFLAYENAVLGQQNDPHLQTGPGQVFLTPATLTERCMGFMQEFDIRPADPFLRGSLFSGGNQQKLVIARELANDPDILLIGQPTRGVDIGAIEFIHQRLLELRNQGKAILLVSSELEEIMALSDRIAVICAGRITGETTRAAANEQKIGMWMAGEAA
jgi:ABC-type uncharacterized transport system ATPase subunit